MNVQIKPTESVIAIVIHLLTLVQRDSTLLTIINLESLIFIIFGGQYGYINKMTIQNKQILLEMTFSCELTGNVV